MEKNNIPRSFLYLYILSIYSPFSGRLGFLFITFLLSVIPIDYRVLRILVLVIRPYTKASNADASVQGIPDGVEIHNYIYSD